MKVTLLSNVPHYHYLARALHRIEFLHRYITAIALAENERPPAFLPAFWQKKLEGRRMRDIPEDKVRQIWIPELLQRGLPRLNLISWERANWINNHLFDRAAQKYIQGCDAFHFVSSVGLYSARKAKQAGAKIVCDVRQEHPLFQRRVLSEEAQRHGVPVKITGHTFESKVLREFDLADYLIVPSQHAKRTFLAEGFDAQKIAVIPYGVDLKHFQPAGRRDSVFRIVHIGQVTIRKGIPYLLEAFKQLRLPNSELLLIGTMDPAMKPILARYEGLFRYLPPMPKVQLYPWYSDSSVFVLPSMADAYPLAVLEAMACGLPVIISKNTGTEDTITDGREGFVVPVRDVEALKQRLLHLYENEEKRVEMGKAAQALAFSRSWDRYEGESIQFYQDLAQGHQPSAISNGTPLTEVTNGR